MTAPALSSALGITSLVPEVPQRRHEARRRIQQQDIIIGKIED